MARHATAIAFTGALLLSAGLFARPPVRPTAEQTKIDYLLGELRASPETFIRNGREHSGKRAASHLARKLSFAGRRVQTARDFVHGIGSRSLDSGKPYLVRSSDGKQRPLSQWLLDRLDRYEKENLPKATPPAGRSG